MLIVTRKAGQAVYIGDNIVVRILSSQNGQFRVGIEAPKDIQILRDDAKKGKPEVARE